MACSHWLIKKNRTYKFIKLYDEHILVTDTGSNASFQNSSHKSRYEANKVLSL